MQINGFYRIEKIPSPSKSGMFCVTDLFTLIKKINEDIYIDLRCSAHRRLRRK